MAIKDMLASAEYRMMREKITFRLDNLGGYLVLCDESELKALQGEIRALMWVLEELPQTLLNAENPPKEPESEDAEKAMFGGGDDDEYES